MCQQIAENAILRTLQKLMWAHAPWILPEVCYAYAALIHQGENEWNYAII